MENGSFICDINLFLRFIKFQYFKEIQQQSQTIGLVKKMENYKMQKTDQLITLIPQQHQHSLIWLHGLNSTYEANLNALVESLGDHLKHVKVLIPSAPTRYVTLLEKQTKSWFNVKSRGKQCFQLPFDQAFSSAQVYDSNERIIKPLIDVQREILDKNNEKGLLIMCGFSQGCGLALHCFYQNQRIDAGLAISGYMFSITKFDPNCKRPLRILYGKNDKVRPWESTKVTYEGKIPSQKIKFISGMGHQVSSKTVKQMKAYFNQLLAK